MPRESRAIPKYGGSEIEYAITSPDGYSGRPSDLAWDFVSLIQPEWLSGGSFSSWDSRPRLKGAQDCDHGYFKDEKWIKANFLLEDGARLYVDGAHPEFSTALCRMPKEKLAHYKAADRIMQNLVLRHREAGRNYALAKTNYGFDPVNRTDEFRSASPQVLADYATSFAHHDNYLVRRDVPGMDLIERTIPWLVLRQIFNGQGKVGSHNRLVTGLPWCNYQISQRADFFSKCAGIDTMGFGDTYPSESCRPIYNMRDVSYADSALYRRAHMIPADHNMCETAYFLTAGLTAVHFMMLEDGFLDDRFLLTDPVRAFWQISRDLEFRKKVSMQNRAEPRLPLDILEEYVMHMGEYLVLYDIREPEYHTAVALGLEVITRLRNNSMDCIGILDWVSKLAVIEGLMARGRIASFCSHKAIACDRSYGNIDPAKSIFFQEFIQERHWEYRIITDADIDAAISGPPPTRSAFQVAVHRLFDPFVRRWHWAETEVWVSGEDRYYTIYFDNPLITPAEYQSLLEGADRHEFLRRALSAGIAKKSTKRYAQSTHSVLYPAYPENDE